MENYLIASESYKCINEELSKLIPHDLETIKIDLRINSIKDLISEANYFSLTGETKNIIVKCGNLFKAKKEESEEDNNEDIKLLENYLSHPNEKCNIYFTSNVLPDKRKKLYKYFKNINHDIIIETLNKKDLVYKCMSLLKEKGYKSDYETSNYIVENSYTNYDIMLSELDKIYMLLAPCELTINKISDIISKSINNTTFAYINAILDKNLEKAIKYSENFGILKIEPIMILILLYKEFDMYYHLLKGENPKDLQNLYHKESWQMENYLNNKHKFKLNEVKKIIIKLNDYDYKLKSGLIDHSLVIDLLTMDLCD